jgi:hypothetical protein
LKGRLSASDANDMRANQLLSTNMGEHRPMVRRRTAAQSRSSLREEDNDRENGVERGVLKFHRVDFVDFVDFELHESSRIQAIAQNILTEDDDFYENPRGRDAFNQCRCFQEVVEDWYYTPRLLLKDDTQLLTLAQIQTSMEVSPSESISL